MWCECDAGEGVQASRTLNRLVLQCLFGLLGVGTTPSLFVKSAGIPIHTPVSVYTCVGSGDILSYYYKGQTVKKFTEKMYLLSTI